jgi:hypothetical protein
MSDLEQALSRLEAHERECSIRYEMIQMQLDAHNQRFDKLEKMMTGWLCFYCYYRDYGYCYLGVC